ncbi:actin-like [Alosa sapidissima]|uniref:actin-like n=1 Tax=Alosa sapidissima TaxID=34773 RepID=UPI001C08CEF3|nr:actin-like [Alosa sapidissima]
MAGQQSADFLDNMAIVIDPGSAYTKAGFSGEEHPRTVVRSTAGLPTYTPGESSRLGAFRGNRGPGTTTTTPAPSPAPACDSLLGDWDALESLWGALLQDELGVCPQDHAILVSDCPLAPPVQRARLAELLFEGLGVPALYVSHAPLLSLYSYGLVTGLQVDAGASGTRVCPVYSGYCLPHAARGQPLGGAAFSAYLQQLLEQRGPGGGVSERRATLREAQSHSCYVAQDFERELQTGSEVTEYRLPDGTTVALGNERFRSAELLFCPSLAGEPHPGVHILALSSVRDSAPQWQKQLLAHVALSGGTSLLPGFPERLQLELERLAPRGSRVIVHSAAHRHLAAWVGGAIMASLRSVRPLWVTSADYQEHGPDTVLQHCY